MARSIKTHQTTVHLSKINRLFLDSQSEVDRRSLSATLDLIVEEKRVAMESRSCQPHIQNQNHVGQSQMQSAAIG